jgi:hypothetical protein
LAAARQTDAWLPLLREGLARDGRARLTLRGDSMAPTLPQSCEIEVAPLPAGVRLGDLLVFAAGDALVAHRLVRCSGAQWITQGDGRLGPDPPLDPSQVLGIVVTAYTLDGRRCWPGRSARPLAWLWIARAAFLRPLRRIRRALARAVNR